MPNRSSDILFALVKSLEKAEKRNFKLYITRSSGKSDLKVVQLFDALDKLDDYDELLLLKKLKSVEKPQLANLKSHLYKQILSSLRLLKSTESIDMQLHEQIDFARILYNKALYHQSLKILDKVKELAYQHHQESYIIQAISLEKKIESLHITRSMQDRAAMLSKEAKRINEKRRNITRLSNLAMKLYSWYIKNGHARNLADEQEVIEQFRSNLERARNKEGGFYEDMYLYQCYTWYGFIRQDFLMYYRYTQKWVDLFEKEPVMKTIEPSHYIKGCHNLLNALFDLKFYSKNYTVLKSFEAFANSPAARVNQNIEVYTFVYLHIAKLNRYISTGSFYKGVALVPELEKKVEQYQYYLDPHRVLVFNYKIATIYFANEDYETCIDYLRKIINDQPGLRNDLQCYARLLHLMAHYELGNTEIIESLIKSVYRFMAKMQNLTVTEEAMFKFLKNSFYTPHNKLQPAFKKFYEQIKHLETNRFETRAYAYLDIFSWVEGKVEGKTIGQIIKAKYLASKRQ